MLRRFCVSPNRDHSQNDLAGLIGPFGGKGVIQAGCGACRRGAAGLLGKPDEFGKWFAPLKWIFGDGTVARGPARGPPARSVSVEVATAVKKQTGS